MKNNLIYLLFLPWISWIYAQDQSALGWKLTFQDEFDDAKTAIQKGADPDCFSGKPICLYHNWKRRECKDEDYHEGLKNINRCNWSVWGMYNWMDNEASAGKGINAFHPSQVSIKDGKLLLSAVRSDISLVKLNCKNLYQNPEYDNDEMQSVQCLVYSGGVDSGLHHRNGVDVGFVQEYGRFEVRAKLSNGPGSWPAHWLLPGKSYAPDDESACGTWPFRGEIDIMEAWENSPQNYSGSYHDGICKLQQRMSHSFAVKATQSVFPYLTKSQLKETFYKDFHTYSVEWDEKAISFFVDDYWTGTMAEGDLTNAREMINGVTGEKTGKLPLEIAKGAFYILLNNSITPDSFDRWKNLKANQSAGENLVHAIDYVRVYKRCTKDDDHDKCYHPKIRDLDQKYNIDKTPAVDMNVYPNPAMLGQEVNLRITAQQSCTNFRLQLADISGRIYPANYLTMQNQSIGSLSLSIGQDYYYTVDTTQLKNGIYFLNGLASGCGSLQKDSSNYSIKFSVIN